MTAFIRKITTTKTYWETVVTDINPKYAAVPRSGKPQLKTQRRPFGDVVVKEVEEWREMTESELTLAQLAKLSREEDDD